MVMTLIWLTIGAVAISSILMYVHVRSLRQKHSARSAEAHASLLMEAELHKVAAEKRKAEEGAPKKPQQEAAHQTEPLQPSVEASTMHDAPHTLARPAVAAAHVRLTFDPDHIDG